MRATPAPIRREIDALDQVIIRLLGKRFQYVLAASKYKTSATSVHALERFKAMVATRRGVDCGHVTKGSNRLWIQLVDDSPYSNAT